WRRSRPTTSAASSYLCDFELRTRMTGTGLSGVIAAIATAVDEQGDPDCARSTALARHLLAHGCDGLNVLGTTGEATSFSLDQRKRVMAAYRDAGLPLDR